MEYLSDIMLLLHKIAARWVVIIGIILTALLVAIVFGSLCIAFLFDYIKRWKLLSSIRKPLAKYLTDECCICFNKIKYFANLECGHIFCRECISNYTERKNSSCPLCRKPIKIIENKVKSAWNGTLLAVLGIILVTVIVGIASTLIVYSNIVELVLGSYSVLGYVLPGVEFNGPIRILVMIWKYIVFGYSIMLG